MQNAVHSLSEKDFQRIIKGCKRKNRSAQHELYKSYYSVGIGFLMERTSCMKTSIALLNASFLRVLSRPKGYPTRKHFDFLFVKILSNEVANFKQGKRPVSQLVQTKSVFHCI